MIAPKLLAILFIYLLLKYASITVF